MNEIWLIGLKWISFGFQWYSHFHGLFIEKFIHSFAQKAIRFKLPSVNSKFNFLRRLTYEETFMQLIA